MDATKYTGVFSPEQAATLWADGMEQRSAAMQYTVMTAALQDEYARQLDNLRSNWVTGESSPSVQSYTLAETKELDDAHAVISIRVEVGATYSDSEFYNAKLWLVREGVFWRINSIDTDEGLYIYTYFRP